MLALAESQYFDRTMESQTDDVPTPHRQSACLTVASVVLDTLYSERRLSPHH
jgi:hypothetical protein